jgi:hypothetical protein
MLGGDWDTLLGTLPGIRDTMIHTGIGTINPVFILMAALHLYIRAMIPSMIHFLDTMVGITIITVVTTMDFITGTATIMVLRMVIPDTVGLAAAKIVAEEVRLDNPDSEMGLRQDRRTIILEAHFQGRAVVPESHLNQELRAQEERNSQMGALQNPDLDLAT